MHHQFNKIEKIDNLQAINWLFSFFVRIVIKLLNFICHKSNFSSTISVNKYIFYNIITEPTGMNIKSTVFGYYHDYLLVNNPASVKQH